MIPLDFQLLYSIITRPRRPKTLDMEPPEDVISSNFSTFSTLRIRGGMEHDPIDRAATTVPKLTAMNFMWDGQPSTRFMEEVMYPLYMGLGSIQDRGSSLFETIKRIDKGGVRANPSRAVCLASGNQQLIQSVEDSKSRNRRAFCVILNYTDYKSETYRFFMRDFNYDGIDVVDYMLSNFIIPLPPHQLVDKSSYFDNMTMSKLNLPYTLQGYTKFLDKCIAIGNELEKSSASIATRFANGLPNIADKIASDMRKEINERKYLFPATYGAMTTRTFPASWATRATPDPGNTDYWGLAGAHINEWMIVCKGVRANPPKGFVREVNDESFDHHFSPADQTLSGYSTENRSSIDRVNLIAAKDISWTNECVVCFGKGHAAKQKTDDGTVIKCATLELQTKPADLIPGKSAKANAATTSTDSDALYSLVQSQEDNQEEGDQEEDQDERGHQQMTDEQIALHFSDGTPPGTQPPWQPPN